MTDTNEVDATDAGRPLRVILESPYASEDTPETNLKYGRDCLRDSLDRGEAPIASHLLHTQVLDDNNPSERMIGIQAGVAWISVADLVAVYTDLGLSSGMKYAIEQASRLGIPVEFRELEAWTPIP